jgi:hypothetical protein
MSGGGTNSVTSTYSEISNNPPSYDVIFIKPTTTVTGIPDDSICFVDTSDVLGMAFCNGSDSTPDLRNKYLKGAATDGDSGGTGGSLTNIHTLTHTHTVSTHTHSGSTTGASLGCDSDTDRNSATRTTHTHSWVSSAVSSTYSGTVSLTTLETVEPAYTKLMPVQNQTGNAVEAVGMIGMWLGRLDEIPDGWSEVPSMRGKHLKCANTATEIYTTGGSNTHTHAAQNHTHTAGTHTHSIVSGLNHPSSMAYRDSTSGTSTQETYIPDNPIHSSSVSTNAASFNNAATTGASSSNEPLYRTVAFIKLTNIIAGGAFLFNMI